MEYSKYEYTLYNHYGGSYIHPSMESAMKTYNEKPTAWKGLPVKVQIGRKALKRKIDS